MRFDHWLRAFPNRMSRLSRRGSQRLAPIARPAQISHHVERLEPRLVLSATAGNDDYDLVDPAWFQTVSTESNPGATEWIVRLTQSATASISNVADAASVLNVADVSFQILKGLGLPGQVLVRSTNSDADIQAALSNNLNVALFEQDRTLDGQALPNDPRFSELVGLSNTGQFDGTADADIDAPEAWNTVTDTSAFVIAVVDTGVDYTHPDLAANIWTNSLEVPGNNQDDDNNGFIDDVHGFDFRNNDGDPRDDNGHGTHVAGIIAAVGDNSIGVIGVTWRAQIMVLKWLGENNQGRTADAIAALNYSTMMKTRFTQAQQPGSGITGGADVRITNTVTVHGAREWTRVIRGFLRSVRDVVGRHGKTDCATVA